MIAMALGTICSNLTLVCVLLAEVIKKKQLPNLRMGQLPRSTPETRRCSTRRSLTKRKA